MRHKLYGAADICPGRDGAVGRRSCSERSIACGYALVTTLGFSYRSAGQVGLVLVWLYKGDVMIYAAGR